MALICCLCGTCAFSSIQLHAADTQHREHGYGQYNDPDTAQPLEQLPVEQDGLRQRVEASQDRSPCRCQSRDRLEHSIENGYLDRVTEQKWQRPIETEDDPESSGY